MGQRGEVYSTRLVKNDRTYFFNVKENVYGELYMNIVESKGDIDSNRFIRQSVLIYQEDMGEFIREFQKSLDYIKIHGKERQDSRPARYERTDAPSKYNEDREDSRPARYERTDAPSQYNEERQESRPSRYEATDAPLATNEDKEDNE